MSPIISLRTTLALAVGLSVWALAGCEPTQEIQASAQSPVQGPVEWPSYAATAASTKFSTAGQIDAANFSEVEVLWRWQSPDNKLLGQQDRLWAWSWEATPLMIGDTLYTSTSFSQVAAIDARTGETRWVYDPGSWRLDSPSKWFMHRGVAHWANPGHGARHDPGHDPAGDRIFIATNDARLIALDAVRGTPIPAFGEDGAVDLTLGMRRPVDRDLLNMTSPPVVCGDVLVVGSSITDFENKKSMPPGDVRGYDPRTGEQLWTFESIPQPGSLGQDTWEAGSWEYSGNTNVWTWMSCDAQRGLVYLPFGTANSDLYGGHRPGANLFSESIVALDAKSGTRRWHFQVVHHGLWDYDLAAAPILADITVDGSPVPALVQTTKQGFVFVLNRETGDPVWPIEERPVPASEVPGEKAWPTQPIPTRPAPFDRQGLTPADLIEFTPELRAQAADILEKYTYGPVYTPPGLDDTIFMPGWSGGASWAGAALNPDTGMLYVPSQTSPTVIRMQPPEPGTSDLDFIAVVSGLPGPQDLPLFKPPWGRITAIDLNSGDQRWVSAMGEGPRDHPALAGLDLPRLGWARRGFPLLTPTLLFIAQEGKRNFQRTVRGDVESMKLENDDAYLMVYDPSTGEFLGNIELPGNANGSPMTYALDGRQTIIVAIGGGDQPAELVALGLTANDRSQP